MKKILLKLFICILVMILSSILVFDVRILASDVQIVDGTIPPVLYELSCKNVVVKTDSTMSVDDDTLKQTVINACELHGKDKKYLEVALPEINEAGVYPCEVSLKNTDVVVNVSITVVEEGKVVSKNEPVKEEQLPIKEEATYQDSIKIDGKTYEVLVRTKSKVLGNKIIFSDGVNEYIGYFDWGFYLNAKPNFTFFIITISLMIISLVYVLVQNRNQKEYWRYQGDK